jgi:hypothetical protein
MSRSIASKHGRIVFRSSIDDRYFRHGGSSVVEFSSRRQQCDLIDTSNICPHSSIGALRHHIDNPVTGTLVIRIRHKKIEGQGAQGARSSNVL